MRSKAALMISFFMLSAIAFSQTEKGTLIVSGNNSLEFTHTEGKLTDKETGSSSRSKVNTLEFMPAVGYFVADNFAVALSVDYIRSLQKNYKSNQLSFMPTLMYYFPGESSFRPNVQAGFGYAVLKEKFNTYKESFSGYAYGAGLGLDYFISDNIAVGLGIQWIGTKMTYSEDKDLKTTANALGSVIEFSLFF